LVADRRLKWPSCLVGGIVEQIFLRDAFFLFLTFIFFNDLVFDLISPSVELAGRSPPSLLG